MVKMVTSTTWHFWGNATFPPKASHRAHTYLRTCWENSSVTREGRGSAGKRISNVDYSRRKCERADLGVSLHLKVLMDQQPSLWALHYYIPTQCSVHALSMTMKNYCGKYSCDSSPLWCPSTSRFNQTDCASSSQRRPQGYYQRSSAITAGLLCHQRDFQVFHVTAWKAMLFPRVLRLYFAWSSRRTKE